MVNSKVRCITCYNVFNTTKSEGVKIACPMCDANFLIKKDSFVKDARRAVNDLTDKKSEDNKKKGDSFKIIEGKKYDRELIEIAEELTKKQKKISLKGSKQLYEKIIDYNKYTDIEKETIAFIRKRFDFTKKANEWLRREIRKWATRNDKSINFKDPTEDKSNNQISMVFLNLKEAYNWDRLNKLSNKTKTGSQWAGIILSIVFVLGMLSGIAYGMKWSNQETLWDNEGLSAVHGTVIDRNGNVIEGVTVEAGSKTTETNAQGKYYLYDLNGDEIEVRFIMEGYNTINIWTNIHSDLSNILEVEMLEGQETITYDYRNNVVKPWPPNYMLAPIFMISAIFALIGSSAALLEQNFRMAIAGCLFGIISYGFLIGSVLSVIALSLILVERRRFK